MENMAKVTINGETKEYPCGTSYRDIVNEYQKDTEAPIILVTVDGRLRELHKRVKGDCQIEFVTTRDHIGFSTYKRSACLVLLKAIYDVAGKDAVEKVEIHYSVGSGYYFTMTGFVGLDQDFLDQVRTQMHEIVDAKVQICKRSVNTDERSHCFTIITCMTRRSCPVRRVSKVNIYNIGNYEDYFYGYMADHTGYVKYFDLKLYDEGFVLELPERKAPSVIPPFDPGGKNI